MLRTVLFWITLAGPGSILGLPQPKRSIRHHHSHHHHHVHHGHGNRDHDIVPKPIRSVSGPIVPKTAAATPQVKSSGLSSGILRPPPTKPVIHSNPKSCDMDSEVQMGSMKLQGNAWGKSSGSGWQCTDMLSASAWQTVWTWSSSVNDGVKSYPNVIYFPPERQLSQVKSAPTKWSFTYNGKDLRADVAYDIFITSDPSRNYETRSFEIMVWLGQYGNIGPIKDEYGDKPPLAVVDYAGHKFDLWYGKNSGDPTTIFQVYTFIAHDAASMSNSFEGDIWFFAEYLINAGKIPKDQYLWYIGAGTETFSGTDCTFSTEHYEIAVQ